MPLPKPNAGETQNEFMSRCMESAVMMEDFPDSDQRLAVCSTQWDAADEENNSARNLSRYVEILHRRIVASRR